MSASANTPGEREKKTGESVPPSRVLIYRLGSLGDTVVALPALYLVARAFPGAERRMLTNFPVSSKAPAAAAVLGGTGLVQGYFNYKVGTRNLLDLAALWWQLVRWRPQVVVYLAAFRGRDTVVRDRRFFALCGIRRQVGIPLTEDTQKNRWQESEQALEPETARLVRNLAKLGDASLDDPASWDLRLTPEEREKAAKALEPAGGRPVIAVSVGTKIQAKDWGIENWRSLLAELARNFPGYALVLCGAPEEYATSEYAAAGWRGGVPAAVAIDLCGRLTPRESAAVFAEARSLLARQRTDAPGGGSADTLCGRLRGAQPAPGLVSLRKTTSGDISPGRLLGMRPRNLRGGAEEVHPVDHGRRSALRGAGDPWEQLKGGAVRDGQPELRW